VEEVDEEDNEEKMKLYIKNKIKDIHQIKKMTGEIVALVK
jgi:hypothetical protein